MSTRREVIGAIVFVCAIAGFFFLNSFVGYLGTVVDRFEGGAFGDNRVYTTGSFAVKDDWYIDIEAKGEFSAAEVANVFGGSTRLDLPRGSFRETWNLADGGRYVLKIQGNGVWRATIRQGTGKLP